MKSKNTKILYTYTARRSFVNNDIAILEKHFHVTTYYFQTNIKLLTPLSFILQAFYLVVFGWKYKFFVTFFAGYHSVLPALFSKITGKKCIIFLGGTDCFNYPSFQYGNFTKKMYGKMTCISATNASLLVPVSENLILSESSYYEGDHKTQGIYYWCKPIVTPYQIISLEYDSGIFFNRNIEKKKNSFITVAFGISGPSFIRKGIDKVLMIASHCPDFAFTIVGCDKNDFQVQIPENVTLIPPVPYEQLPEYYSQHQFYLQLSIAEGFPSAICEAMLCECIPIGSDVAAIPIIISSFGYLVHKRDDELILDTVRKAIKNENKEILGKAARNHIIETFGKGKREEALLKLFSGKN
jgi:glycosyltransferase involved in cell wall biosynthesis